MSPIDSILTFREKEKIGSLMNIIASKNKGIHLTRMLKFLFLIDEQSIKEIGVPVTPFEYRVAENGPLIVELWSDLKTTNSFSNHVRVTPEKYDNEVVYKIEALGDPNEKRFSEYEIDLIKQIVKNFSGYSTKEIIDHIHEHDGSLWKEAVVENNIDFKKAKISDFNIDFRKHIKGNETHADFYDMYLNMR